MVIPSYQNMVKKAISIKLDPAEIERLKKYAAANNMTLTDLLVSGLQGRKEEDYLKDQVRSLKEQMQELRQQYQNVSGRKPKTNKRVSFTVSLEQYRLLNMESAKQNIPRSQLLQDLVFSQHPKQEPKALPV